MQQQNDKVYFYYDFWLFISGKNFRISHSAHVTRSKEKLRFKNESHENVQQKFRMHCWLVFDTATMQWLIICQLPVHHTEEQQLQLQLSINITLEFTKKQQQVG